MNNKGIQKFSLISLTVLFIGFALYLSIQTLPFKINELLPTEHETRLEFEAYDKSFKNELDFNILIHQEKEFNSTQITSVLKLIHKDLKNYGFIDMMTSLENGEYLKVKGDYIRLTPFTNFNRELIPDYEKILEKDFLTNIFLSKSKKSVLISGQFSEFSNIKEERKSMGILVKRIQALNDYFKGEYNLHIIGTKVAQYYYFLETIRNQSFLTPLLFICLALIIYLLFRSFKILLLFLTIMLVSYSSIVYLITLNEGGVSTYSGFAMFFILVVATSDLVHFFSHYSQKNELSIQEKLDFTKEKVFMPCLLTSLTTALCFVSLIPNSIVPIKNIGLYASLGAILCFVYTFYLLPYFLKIFEINSLHQHRLKSFHTSKLVKLVLEHPTKTIFIFVSLSLTLAMNSKDLKIDDDFYTKFADNHELTKSVNIFQEEFQSLGTIDLVYNIKAGDIQDSENHQKILAFENELQSLSQIAYIKSYSGFYQYVRDAFSHLLDDNNKERRISSLVDMMKTRNIFANFHDEKNDIARSVVFITSTSSLTTVQAIEQIQKLSSKYKDIFTVKEQGFVSLRTFVFNKLTTNFFISFFFSLISIFIVFLFLFRSFFWSLIGLAPNIFPLLLISGALGLLNFPIDSNLVLMICITLGVAVDDTIHFLYSLKHNITEQGQELKTAILNAFESTNKALLGTTLIFSLSFPCFFLAELKIFYQVGGFVIMSLIFALAADFLL
jgi:hypothetical protein